MTMDWLEIWNYIKAMDTNGPLVAWLLKNAILLGFIGVVLKFILPKKLFEAIKKYYQSIIDRFPRKEKQQ